MKQLFALALVLSATNLFSQQQPEGLRVRMDAVFSGETFCVRNEGFLFVFDRNEFFRGNLKNPDADMLATLGDTCELNYSPGNLYDDTFFWERQGVKMRMSDLLEVGRANVYTPDGRVLCELEIFYPHQRGCFGSSFGQRFFVPGNTAPVFTNYGGFSGGCPSF